MFMMFTRLVNNVEDGLRFLILDVVIGYVNNSLFFLEGGE